MKRDNILFALILLPTLAISSGGAPPPLHVLRQTIRGASRAPIDNTRTLRTASDVSISLCIEAGDVTVTGWERDEVEARTASGASVELRAGETASGARPAASNVEVILRSENASARARGQCEETVNVELRVPRGATIEINSRHSRVTVAGVAEARIETVSGEISLRGVTRRTEAKSISGAIRIEDARGGIRARTITGAIRVTNASASAETDALALQTINGEILLDRVAYRTVAAASVIGNVETTGDLASEGRYDFQSNSGDIILNLPADSSFRLNASVSSAGTIITDFPIRHNEERDARSAVRRLTGTHGSGTTAQLNLISHSGTIYLRRR